MTRKKSIVAAVVAVSAVAVAAGITYAAIPDASGVIHACYKTDGGQLRVSDVGTCNPSETQLSWSQEGPMGPQGLQGPQGPAGPPGPGSDVVTTYSSGGGGQQVPIAPINVAPPIAQLPLPAGSYAMFATLDIDNNPDPNFVGCALVAGADVDRAFADLASITDPGDVARLELHTVHTFGSAGTVQLKCSAIAEAFWTHLRITAVRAATITDVPFSAP